MIGPDDDVKAILVRQQKLRCGCPGIDGGNCALLRFVDDEDCDDCDCKCHPTYDWDRHVWVLLPETGTRP